MLLPLQFSYTCLFVCFVLLFRTSKVDNIFVLFLTLKGTWVLFIFIFNYISFSCFLSLLIYSIALYQPRGSYWFYCWGAVDLFFLSKLYVCSKVQKGWQPPVYNHCSHNYLTWFHVRLLKNINSRARHLVIMIQLIWAAAWESIFLEKFAGTSDYR